MNKKHGVRERSDDCGYSTDNTRISLNKEEKEFVKLAILYFRNRHDEDTRHDKIINNIINKLEN